MSAFDPAATGRADPTCRVGGCNRGRADHVAEPLADLVNPGIARRVLDHYLRRDSPRSRSSSSISRAAAGDRSPLGQGARRGCPAATALGPEAGQASSFGPDRQEPRCGACDHRPGELAPAGQLPAALMAEAHRAPSTSPPRLCKPSSRSFFRSCSSRPCGSATSLTCRSRSISGGSAAAPASGTFALRTPTSRTGFRWNIPPSGGERVA